MEKDTLIIKKSESSQDKEYQVLIESELKSKFDGLTLDDLRKAIMGLHNQIKEFKTYINNPKNYQISNNLDKWIRELIKNDPAINLKNVSYYDWIKYREPRVVKGLGDMSSFEKLLPVGKGEDRNEIRRKIAEEVLIHIFFRKYRVQPVFGKDNKLIFKSGSAEKLKVEYKNIESGNVAIYNDNIYFIFYYHRAASFTQQDPETVKENEHIDKGKLIIDEKWENATLFIEYPKPIDNRRETYLLEFTGKISSDISSNDEKNAMITLFQKNNPNTKISNIISILLPKNFKEKSNLAVSYLKYHQKRGFPTAGVGFLHKMKIPTEVADLNKHVNDEWEKKDIKDSIKYYLYGKRFNALLPDMFDGKDIDINYLYENQINRLKEITGIYKGIMVNHGPNGPNDNIAVFILKIHNYGFVEIKSGNKHYGERYYIGQCKFAEKEKVNWIIDFNYSEKSDIYFSKLMLSNREDNNLYGTLIYDGSPRSSKVFFEYIDDCLYKDENGFSVIKDIMEFAEQSKYIPIFKDDNITDETKKIFENEAVRKFLLDGFINDNTIHTKYSDTNTLYKIFQLFNLEQLPKEIVGIYDLLSFTLETENKPIREYSDDDTTIWKYPVELLSNGKAKMKIQSGKIIEGTTKFIENRLSINFFHIELCLDALFDLPDLVHYDPNKFSGFNGTMIRMNRLGSENISEGRICILYRVENKLNSKANICENLRFSCDENKKIEWDKRYFGSISMLTGPVNRIVRAEKNPQNPYPRIDQNSYKKDFFYSACFLSRKYFEIKNTNDVDNIQKAFEEISNRLFAAWIHRFAATHFIDKEIIYSRDFDRSNKKLISSIEQIITEQKELILAMKEKDENYSESGKLGYFCDDSLRNEIKRLWGETLFYRDQELREWLEKTKQTENIIS